MDDTGASRVGILSRMPATGVMTTSHYNTAGTLFTDNGNAVTVNTRFTTRAKHTTNTIESWLDGASSGSTATTGTLRSNNSILQLFYRSGTSNEGRLYKGFCVIGRATTALEDAEIDAWTAAA